MAVITETKTVNGKDYIYHYSDSGKMIERNGNIFAEAYDPIDKTDRVYIETDIPIEMEFPEKPTDQITSDFSDSDAVSIIMGEV